MRKMRDSGVEWIGQIPVDWKLSKIKHHFSISSGTTPKSDEPQYWDGDIVWITPADFKTDDVFVSKGHRNLSQEGYRVSSLQLVPAGSIIFSKRAPIGQVVINAIDLCTNQGCLTAVLNDDSNVRFYRYVMSIATEEFELAGSGTTFKEISATRFENILLPLTSKQEQTKCADYLDAKCSKIDEIIEKQQAIIEKLKEYKLSIITEAVTKGLNPDVEMKDSGNIEIGKIPSISKPTKLKHLCNTQGRIGFKGYTTADLVDEGEGAYTLGASHLNNGKIDLTDPVFISWEKYYESPEIMVKQNDILIVQRGSTIGKVAIVDKNYGEVTINPSLVLINKIHIDSKYLLYALSARYIVNYINLIGTTTAIPMISQKQINDLVIIVPPDSIQISVVKYLDEKCGKIDANILKKQKLIDKLQEYKKSLIYEVVTGKKEV